MGDMSAVWCVGVVQALGAQLGRGGSGQSESGPQVSAREAGRVPRLALKQA